MSLLQERRISGLAESSAVWHDRYDIIALARQDGMIQIRRTSDWRQTFSKKMSQKCEIEFASHSRVMAAYFERTCEIFEFDRNDIPSIALMLDVRITCAKWIGLKLLLGDQQGNTYIFNEKGYKIACIDPPELGMTVAQIVADHEFNQISLLYENNNKQLWSCVSSNTFKNVVSPLDKILRIFYSIDQTVEFLRQKCKLLKTLLETAKKDIDSKLKTLCDVLKQYGHRKSELIPSLLRLLLAGTGNDAIDQFVNQYLSHRQLIRLRKNVIQNSKELLIHLNEHISPFLDSLNDALVSLRMLFRNQEYQCLGAHINSVSELIFQLQKLKIEYNDIFAEVMSVQSQMFMMSKWLMSLSPENHSEGDKIEFYDINTDLVRQYLENSYQNLSLHERIFQFSRNPWCEIENKVEFMRQSIFETLSPSFSHTSNYEFQSEPSISVQEFEQVHTSMVWSNLSVQFLRFKGNANSYDVVRHSFNSNVYAISWFKESYFAILKQNGEMLIIESYDSSDLKVPYFTVDVNILIQDIAFFKMSNRNMAMICTKEDRLFLIDLFPND